MHRFALAACFAASLAVPVLTAPKAGKTPKPELVEIEMMTHPEIYSAIHDQGKTMALVYNGGTEQRGPQCVLGGHTLMGRATVRAIALKLGNALAAPVMPFSPNDANPNLPGTIGLPAPVFAAVNEAVVDQMVKNGFKTVVLMGDHGGGQKELEEVAQRTDQKYSPQGVRVFYCKDVYSTANKAFDDWLKARGYPLSGHAGIPDTSEMMYLGGDAWVRKDKITFGDPVLPPGQKPDPNANRINNGITGDARPSSPELGKRLFDMKVNAAVAEIQKLSAAAKTSAS